MSMRLGKRKRPPREEKPFKERDKITERSLDAEAIDAVLAFINGGLIKSLDYPIAEGKESTVFRASAGGKADVRWEKGVAVKAKGEKPKFFAVKVFKHDTSAFQKMSQYIEGDPRFGHAKHNRRELARQWAAKEFANLQRAQETGAPLPKPVRRRGNVVVMEFIGTEEGLAFAKLQDVVLAEPEKFLEKILEGVRKLYSAKLVHADLSPYNILVKEVSEKKGGKDEKGEGNKIQEPLFIDAGQAVLLQHPAAKEFLERDLRNLLNYFKKLGVHRDLGEEMKGLAEARESRIETS